MKELDHTFGDDGIFWISYKDFLKFYPEIDRIRLIGPEWTVTQQWTAVTVPWTADYLDTSFSLSITKAGPVVLVLSQPDERYFQGLTGRYKYDLHFRLYRDGEETYLLRSMEKSGSSRSCSAELELEPGNYTILVKVLARRYDKDRTAEEIIKQYREERRDKLLAVGKSFDLTHSKGRLREMEEEDISRERREERLDRKEKLHRERAQRRKDRLREKMRRNRKRAAEKLKKEVRNKERKESIEKRKAERAAKKKEATNKRRQESNEKKNAEKAAKRTEEDDRKRAEEEEKAKAGTKDDGDKEGKVNEKSEEKPDAKVEAKPDSKAEEVSNAEVEEKSDAKKEDTTAGTEKSATESTAVEQKPADVAERLIDEKDTASVRSVTTTSTGPGQPTPDQTPEPSSNGKEEEAAAKTGIESTTESTEVKLTAQDEKATETEDSKREPAAEEEETTKEPVHDDAKSTEAQEIEEIEEASCESDAEEDTISEISSVADSDFSWNSEMDGPGASSSEDEDDDPSADEDDMFAEDPWNARCVIGLRVCSYDPDAAIVVVHGGKEGAGVPE
jgi:hypothetical protein